MLNKVAKKAAAAFLALMLFTPGNHEARKTISEPSGPHKHFIQKLRSLNKRYKYILLGDNNHASPEIREVLADPEVMRTFKELGYDDLVLEDSVKQNRGYDPVVIPAEPQKLDEAVGIVHDAFSHAAPTTNTISRVLDQDTQNGLAFEIAATNRASGVRESGGPNNLLSEEFLRGQEAALLKMNYKERNRHQPVIEALRYLKDTGNAPVLPTFATELEDLCVYDGSLDDLIPEARSPYHQNDAAKGRRWIKARLETEFNACKARMTIYYPDEDMDDFDAYPAAGKIFDAISEETSGDEIYDDILTRAKMNYSRSKAKDVMRRDKATARFNQLIEARAHRPVNDKIAENIRNFTGSRHAVIKYGNAHTDLLKTDLGVQDTLVIDILPDRNYKLALFDEFMAKTFENYVPDIFYEAADDHIVAVDNGAHKAEFLAHRKYSLTREEYDGQIKKLPLQLQNYAPPFDDYRDKQLPQLQGKAPPAL